MRIKFLAVIAIAAVSVSLMCSGVFANGTPAGTTISAGWDNGVANTADTFGDLVISYMSGATTYYSYPAASVSSTVTAVYGNMLPDSAGMQNVMPGDTVWFPLVLTNKANASDSPVFGTQNFAYYGLGADSITVSFWNAAKSARITNLNLAEDGYDTFNVAVYFKSGVDNGDSVAFEVSAIARGGLGGDTGGYTGANGTQYAGDGNDTILLVVQATAALPQIYISKSATVDNTGLSDFNGDTSKVVPGSVLIFNIQYDNDGSGSADSVSIVTYIPANTDFNTATIAMCSPDTNNIGFLTIQYADASGSFQSTPPTNTVMIKWILGHPVLAQEDSEGTDTVGVVDGDSQDADSGRLQYKVIVK